jgi:hypothetical protein
MRPLNIKTNPSCCPKQKLSSFDAGKDKTKFSNFPDQRKKEEAAQGTENAKKMGRPNPCSRLFLQLIPGI